jgi:hypothetical protein
MQQLFVLAASVLALLGTSPIELSRANLVSTGVDQDADPSPCGDGLCLSLDLGAAPGRQGFRLRLEGARAHSAAWLELGQRTESGLLARRAQLVRTDANGRAELKHFGPLPSGFGARFVARATGSGGGLSATTIVDLPGPGSYATSSVQRGDIVITEIMKDPTFVTDTHGEWFELMNITNRPINIAGWKITDLGSNAHTINNNGQLLVMQPGARLVLGNDANPLTNGGVHVDYKYTNFTLGNGADSILLTARKGDLVDQVDYDDGIFWPDVPGKSLTLDPFASDVYLNDDPVNWCAALSAIGGGNPDLGTPFLLNDDCP